MREVPPRSPPALGTLPPGPRINVIATLQQRCSRIAAALLQRLLILFTCRSQVLKRLFENSNWNSPTSTVARKWMLRRIFMRDQRLTEEDYGGYDFDFLGNQLITGDSLLSVIWTSPLLAAVSRTQASVSSMRYLHEVRLCSLSIQVQDWVLLRYGCAVRSRYTTTSGLQASPANNSSACCFHHSPELKQSRPTLAGNMLRLLRSHRWLWFATASELRRTCGAATARLH